MSMTENDWKQLSFSVNSNVKKRLQSSQVTFTVFSGNVYSLLNSVILTSLPK